MTNAIICEHQHIGDEPFPWPESADQLDGLPIKEQLRWFILKEDGECPVTCDLLNLEKVFMLDGRICGVETRGHKVILGSRLLIDSVSDNNGAGYKTRNFYIRLLFQEPSNEDWFHMDGDTLHITGPQPLLSGRKDSARPWPIDDVRHAVIHDSAKSLNEYALHMHPNLEDVVVDQGVQSIGSCAFRGCPNLRSAYLPESVSRVGIEAFYACPSLEIAVVEGPVEPALFPGAYTPFNSSRILTIRCHKGSVMDTYAQSLGVKAEYLE